MSARLFSLALDADVPSPAAKLVLAKLCDVCDDEGRRIYPSVARLAKVGQCSERTVQRVLRDFCAVGLLRRVRDGGHGPGSTAHYEMDVGVLRRLGTEGWPEAVHVAGQASGDLDESGLPESGATPLPDPLPQRETEQDAAGDKGDTMSPLGAEAREGGRVTPETEKGDTIVSPNPSNNPSRLRESAGASPDAPAGAGAGIPAYPPSELQDQAPDRAAGDPAPEPPGAPTLDQFRKRWPTTALDDAVRTASAWGDLGFGERKAAFEAVPAFLALMKAMGRARIPAAFTYLTQRRWEGLETERATHDAAHRHVMVGALTKDWWAVLLDRFAAGKAVGFMLARAEEGGGYQTTLGEFPARLRDRLKACPAGSEHAAAWFAWLAGRRNRLPALKPDTWVFLPPEPPPGHEGLSEADRGVVL